MIEIDRKNIFITGGAGFIGSNIANYYLSKGNKVAIFDDFSRKGAILNIKWLRNNFKKNLCVVKGNVVSDIEKLKMGIKDADIIFHFAGQVAVTTSVENPKLDFESNAIGSFNVLEMVRKFGSDPILFYSSTNKVYGNLEGVKVLEEKKRYLFKDYPNGVSEKIGLDFHSPYGCSKGAADQYFRDYSRIYGLKSVVFRQSCIYGYRQFGVEDQGWVAWFIIAHLLGKKLTIYGNGKQVRDILFIEDLINAYDMAIKKIKKIAGRIYNIGGSGSNSISLIELIELMEKITNKNVDYSFDKWRPGDQKIYVSDISKAKKEFNWEPKIRVDIGVKKLVSWIKENIKDIKSI